VAMSKLMTAAAGWPGWIGCVIGGVAMTIYSAAGGLKSTVWVNVVQLTVKLLGFAIALPLAFIAVGGISHLHTATMYAAPLDYWHFWQGGGSGWMYLTTVGTSFIVSPGLLQKTYGARDDRAVRLGIGLNAVVLLVYAMVPVLLGMIARVLHPGLLELVPPDKDLALPMLLVHDLPPAVGMLTLAALFSAEMSAADAALFMLTTSLSQDLYRRFLNPQASDRRLLTVSRWTAAVAGTFAVAIAVVVPSVSDTLTIFYTLLPVSLFVPLLSGLYVPRAGAPEALAAIAAGVSVVAVLRVWNGAGAFAGLPMALWGLIAAAMAALIVGIMRPTLLSVNVKAKAKES
jgi:SSS family solute:Na+ symporter